MIIVYDDPTPAPTSIFGNNNCGDVITAVDQQPSLSTLAAIYKSDSLEPQLKSDLSNPNFAAEICAPTNDAFDQFYDRNGIDQSTFLGNPELLNQVVKVNIIPGGLSGVPDEGDSIFVDSLLDDQQLQISNNNGDILVKSGSGPEAMAIGSDSSPCQASITILDQVLEPNNIGDLSCSDYVQPVLNDPNLSMLASAFQADALEPELKSNLNSRDFSADICAPTNDAFMQFFDDNGIDQSTFLANPELLNQVLKVNIIPGGLPGGAPPPEGQQITVPSLVEGQDLVIQNQGGSIFVNAPSGPTAQVVGQDTSPCQGAVTSIDQVLVPNNLDDLIRSGNQQVDPCLDVLTAVQANSDLSTLAQAFQSDALEPELKSSLTDPNFLSVICAPTNDAFDQFFDQAQIDQSTFLSNPELLNQVVKVNIIPGGLPGGQPPPEGQQYKTNTLLDNQSLTISNDAGTIQVQGPDGNTVTVQGVSEPNACNSQITLIDGVVQPRDVDSLVGGGPSCLDVSSSTDQQSDLTTLAAAFKSDALDSELRKNLNDVDFQATICAPTDAAFDQFFDSSGIDKSTFLGNPALLNQVIKVGIIPGPPGTPGEGESATVPTLLPNNDLLISNEGGTIIAQGPSGLPATVQKVVDDPCQSVLAVLDQVLLPDTSIFYNPFAIGENFLP
eukprot:TRINITY_DN5298_c0_g1_i4.p1 TRINITY_DN5298_c0_g1~~TRINITY_DN5298_c0_g1_i4.p1  ORF type:complete len:731 (+),score=138.20 TRINITY_DN5298_c0_g1_i4:187-2193(+)